MSQFATDLQKSEDILYRTKNKKTIDLNFERYAQISGVKGYQFGKEVYSSMLKFKDLSKFLEVFPKIQRSMSKNNVKSLKKYILSGIGDEENSEAYMRFFNSITVTCKGTIIYDDDKRTILIDTNSKMSINDGQHRTESVKEAIQELKTKIEKTSDLSEKTNIEKQLEMLEEMTIPVIIFNGLDEEQESQLFFDLNNLARRPSKSANIRLSQTDLFAKMAKEIGETNRYFIHYGVETDKQSIFKSNQNTFLLTTIYNSIKELLSSSLVCDKNFLKKKNFDRVKNSVNSKFEKILFALPDDMDTKGRYIIEKSYALIGICKFVSQAKEERLFANEDDIYTLLGQIDWTYKNEDWLNYGGIRGIGKNTNVMFSASSSGQKAVFKYLLDKADEFNKKKEKEYLK
jgi:DNA sulfur modification protein DndB